jgi:hypothetical protein
MRHGGGFRFLAALLFIGFMGLFTLGAFGVGLAIGAGSSGAAFTGWGHGGAIGLLLTILIFLILLRMIGFMIFGHHRHWARRAYFQGGFDGGPFGPGEFGPSFGRRVRGDHGGWHRGGWREASQAYFDEFHNRAHNPQSPAPGAAPQGDQPK